MPGTTRYSATFDRTYEEEDRVDPPAPTNARRSRSASWQANTCLDGGRPYTPLGGRPPAPRSSSTDNGPAKGAEFIPTRTSKTTVKAHNNPFQFVAIGTCPLYKKAEEQLKKVKEVKKVDVLKEEEEDWQSNLDSWKSRRRKMSEDVFKRQEEIKKLELEEQIAQISQTKQKTKTFSEMVESRATRGRALSLCLLNSPLEFQNWEYEDKTYKNGSCSLTDESGENSTVNSEDEGVSIRRRLGRGYQSENDINHRTNGDAHFEQSSTKSSFLKGNNAEDNVQIKPKESSYIDSGLESISSSHRAGDTPDSGSDFSQDSNSSIDCDSPRTGVNLLEEFSSKASQVSEGHEISVKLNLEGKEKDFGFTFVGGKDEGDVVIASVLEGTKAALSDVHVGDKIINIDGSDVSLKKHSEIAASLQKCKENRQISLLLWRHSESAKNTNGLHSEEINNKLSKVPQNAKYEKSVESENEMYVDDYEELQRQSELLAKSKTSEMTNSEPQNTNSQNNNVPAKQSEEHKNSNDSLNVVFQSQKSNVCLKTESVNLESMESNALKKTVSTELVPDVPPVEKVAEEMEKLILEQLEAEERAKELSSGLNGKNPLGSPEHLLTAPPKLAEPPKEKPPPPPSTNEGNQKEPSLKRVNSTKRIKKEIHKRKSNFLGIDSADENIACSEPSIPPPPALEEILKAEIELDRQSRLKIENAATERLILEEKEIMLKEKEIIESLESEERQKQAIIASENEISNMANDVNSEEIRIESLKNERKRLETQRQLSEEQQQIHILEEKQLREREEFIRQQEAINSAGPLSGSISVSATAANTPGLELSSLSSKTQSNVLLLGANGDGKSISNSSVEVVAENKTSEINEKTKVSQKPAVPQKPLKKKEAIRKERERLRQEQEALQREREEHRLKLLLEQEEMMKKSHAPDAPVSRVGLLPPLVPPSFQPQLTTTMNPALNSREKSSFPSRSHHGAINGAVGSINAVDIMSPPVVRHNKLPPSNKAVVNEAWGQQKMPSVRKQNQDSLPESRYNQNHWLIQEAEMRRIAELKERQRAAQLSCSQTHLAEDDVCSNPPRVPVIPPVHNPHLNYAAQDKVWNHPPSAMPLKKYPPPVVKETPLNTIPPRDTVSQKPPNKPSRVVPMDRQEQMLSVSGRKRCSHCNEELGRGAAMIIESLQLYYHIHCFQCCVCQAQLGNGSCGTDVRVRNNKLHCHNCYSNDEAGLKFSQV